MVESDVHQKMKSAINMVDELFPEIGEYYRMMFISQVFEKLSSIPQSKTEHKQIGFSTNSLKGNL